MRPRPSRGLSFWLGRAHRAPAMMGFQATRVPADRTDAALLPTAGMRLCDRLIRANLIAVMDGPEQRRCSPAPRRAGTPLVQVGPCRACETSESGVAVDDEDLAEVARHRGWTAGRSVVLGVARHVPFLAGRSLGLLFRKFRVGQSSAKVADGRPRVEQTGGLEILDTR